MLGTLDQPNLSATAFALMALHVAGGLPKNEEALKRAALFVERLQNKDGGFLFSRIDPTRNKAGKLEGSKEQWNSYGAPTADGVRSLLSCGLDSGESQHAKRLGLAGVRSFLPMNSRVILPKTLHQLAMVCTSTMWRRLRKCYGETKTRQVEGNADWPVLLSTELLKRQADDGSWKNAIVDQREDDPLVATPFAIQALTACRAMLVDEERPAVVQDASGSFTLHARDATCHGERLQFEPQPQKNTLGCWTNNMDYATWKLAVQKPGEYQVVVLQGCGKGQRGSEVAVAVGQQSVTFTVEETGHFQHFKPRSIGNLKLDTGECEVSLKALKKANAAVADVRQIRLIPAKLD